MNFIDVINNIMHNIRDIYIKIKNTTYNAQTVIAKIFLPMKHVVQ